MLPVHPSISVKSLNETSSSKSKYVYFGFESKAYFRNNKEKLDLQVYEYH